MIIAVNTGITGEDRPADEFIFQCLQHLAKNNPQHRFTCFFNTPPRKEFAVAKNITAIIAGPDSKRTLLWKYWYDYKLPSLLKKHKADVLVNMNGICSLRTKLPQCLLVQDLSFLQYPQLRRKAEVRFLKKFTQQFIEKAKTIVTVSEFFSSLISAQYKTAAGKIDVVCGGVDEIFNPISQSEKEIIKENYAEGREYFFSHSNNNLITLLKAFSFFKKRQKSNMMLLITGKTDEPFKEELKTFKFRNEVRLIENAPKEELSKITAAAYAMVHPVFYDALAIAPLQAMRCEVPLVCSNAGALPELCGTAAIYFSPGNFSELAEKMMLVFKDEDKAKELVKAGKTRSQICDWDKTASLLWRSIVKAANN